MATKVTYNKWADPRTESGLKNLRQEYHVEYTLKHLSDMLDDAWPSFEDFFKSCKEGKIVEITPEMDKKIAYRSHTKTKKQLLSLLSNYRSWNQKDPKTGKAYRSEETVDNLYNRIAQNKPLFTPIILVLPDGNMRILSGNTRMDVAFQLGTNPKALLVTVPKSKSNRPFDVSRLAKRPVETPDVEEALGHDNEWGTHELVQKYKSTTPGENSKYTAEARTMTDSILSTVMRVTKPYTQKYMVEAPTTKKAAPILKDWTIDELQKHVMSYVGKHDEQNKLKLTYPAAYTHGMHRGEDNQPLVQMVVDEVNQMAGEQQRHAFAAGFASTRPESVEESTMYGNPNRAPQPTTPVTGKRDAQTHLSCPKCKAEWYSDSSRGNTCPKCKNTSGIVATGSETVYGEGQVKKVTELHEAAEYQGRKVTLNKPFRTPSGPKKFSVYVKNDKGNIVKVNFGDPNMEIKRDDPDRRKAYRNRHNCDNPGPRWKAEYWSCRMWSAKPVSKIAEEWFDTYEGHGYMGYTEVWINPTSDEVAEASGKRQIQVDRSFHTAPTPTAYYCRGWITDEHLFIWSADSDDHMNVEDAVKKSAQEQNLTVNFSNALAVELYYFPASGTLGLHMAPWSNPSELTDTQAVAKVKNHPAIKSLLGTAGKLIPVNN